MGERVTFRSNGGTADGYLADGGGPGVIVIQEWWGLVPHITDVADRFADAGFTALAPDLYHGESAAEPDGAGKLMMALNLDRAAKDLSGAVDLLVARTGRPKIGVVGYCMGGGLALVLACQRPDAVAAVAPYYGVIPWPSAQPDWSALSATVVGEYAELDSFAGPDATHALEAQLRRLGKDATLHIHAGCDHAFFNDTRPEVYNADHAQQAFERTVSLFRAGL
jgi:carboxymethylenebutenolidase